MPRPTKPFNAGDHEVAIFDVVGWKDMEGPTAPLYTEYLKKNGFL
jgi:hypothetical protein